MPARLSIVVPAYNEAARLGTTLRTILDYLNRNEADAELVVVDDGSEDETAAVAERAVGQCGAVSARVIRYARNRGNCYAVRMGLLSVGANLPLFPHAALSPPTPEPPLLVHPT